MSDCKHERFVASVHVNRKVDTASGTVTFDADVFVGCEECSLPMYFDTNNVLVNTGGSRLNIGLLPPEPLDG